MSEAWMDSLSEDWVSQPRSSSPCVSSLQKSPSPSQRPSQTPNKPQSRIPRLSKHTPITSSSLPRPTPSPADKKKILTERRSSDLNIRPRSSSAAATAKTPSPPILARSSSTSSVGSVVRHDSVAYRPAQSSSPHKDSTPEWKRLAFRNQSGPASQQDLFAPIGLEGIFANPSSPDQESPGRNESFSFSEDLQSMPSSPPPWARNRKFSKGTQNSAGTQQSKSKLSIVQEQGESSPQSNAPLSPKLPKEESKPHSSPRATSPVAGTSREAERSGFQQNSTTHFKLSTASTSSRQAPSSVTDGFSPVYISKHNANDGQIAYAAIDPSDPDVQERIRLAQSLSSRNQSQYGANSNCGATQQPRTPEDFAASYGPGELPILSGFVSIERGGYSDEGSFRRRPLSPSLTSSNVPSESVVPSDSVSQVRSTGNNHEEIPHQREQIGQVQEIVAPQTPVQSKSVEQTRSSGSPLKLFGDHDTFTNKQLLRRMSQMDDLPSSSSPHDDTGLPQGQKEQQKSTGAGTDAHGSQAPVSHDASIRDEDIDAFMNKRQVPVPFKQPTPKRQRTIVQAEIDDHATDSMSEQHRRMQTVIGKKRKDALYKSDHSPCEPDQIARRQMLRPRNPTPSHASGSHLRDTSSDLEDDSFLYNFQGQDRTLDKSTGSNHIRVMGPAKIRALASEAASFRANGPKSSLLGSRKPSVSTQDFYNEAVKLMEMLRARNTMTDLTGVEDASVDDHHIEQDLASKRLFTPQTISRPPSREGAPSAWRSRADHVPDAKIMDHLRRFEETGDESFIVASIVRSVKVAQEAAEESDDSSLVQQQDANIRIREGIKPADSTATKQDSGPSESDSPAKTAGSYQSTDSTGRTINTTSSQRARTLGTIDPSKVSHLIQTETSGMRFDTERQTWVRIKSPRKAILQEQVVTSSSTGSEDDPLGKIPDLSVDEEIETLRVNSAGSQSTIATAIEVKRPEPSQQLEESSHLQQQDHDNKTVPASSEPGNPFSEAHHLQAALPESLAMSNEVSVPEHGDARVSAEDIHHQVGRENSELSTRPVSKTPTGTVQSKRRGPSVLFSSPPVSHLWEALHYKSSSDADCEQVDAEYSNLQGTSPDLAMYTQPAAAFLSKWQDVSTAADDFDSELSFSHVEEHREISIMEQRPGGRTMSMTLSISTPLPARRTLSRSLLQSTNALGGSKFLRSLSPMSEFTVHQDDSKHLKSRQLQPGQPLGVKKGTLHASQAVSSLVEKLTDAEPDEPYWDFMRSLSLPRRTLETIHGLDEFCPNVEELDLSSNSLAHLSGAPRAIRTLNVRDNRLTSLTTWAHLTNLQYLNVCGNGIDSLEGFSGLLHLREIKADRNQISSLKGIEDLDGLIDLSLAGNAFEEVDFHGTGLKRLSTLDMSSNKLRDIRGLNSLLKLEFLNVRGNKLTLFDGEVSTTQRSETLQVLDISFNELTGLGVDTFPSLQKICADSNCLVELDGMRAHPSLRTVLLRNQKLEAPSDKFEQSFDDFRDLEHLSLSGTRLPATMSMSQPFHGLRTLDVSFTGLQALPAEFATLAPGVHSLNLNANGIKDLRPVRGLSRLQQLMVAGNRISRMRRVLKLFSDLHELQELDLRNNPVCSGFYGPSGDTAKSMIETGKDSERDSFAKVTLAHLLPPADEELDLQHTARLDDETRLKRRVFELLLGSRSPRLAQLNGLPFCGEKIMAKDQIWQQLVEIGIVEKA